MGENITQTVSQVSAVAELAQRAAEPKPFVVKHPHICEDLEDELGGMAATLLAVPKGHDIVSAKKYLDEYRDAPERRRGTAKLESLESFIEHVNRFKDESSAIFAGRKPPGLVAVLDYHPKGADSAPRFGAHRSAYTFPLSDEWTAWDKSNGVRMKQDQFAEFLESRIVDVRSGDFGEPTSKRLASINAEAAAPHRLLQLSRGLAVKATVNVENAQNLSSGEAQITYAVSHQDAGGKVLDIPSAFVISIPVFQRATTVYEVVVRLRYRLNNHEISWFYEMLAHDVTFEDAFQGACDQAAKGTGLPLFVGSPEA